MKKLKYLVVFFAIVAVVLVCLLSPVVLQFKKYSAADFTQQLTPLVLIALFIERSLEVFLTVWRGGKATTLQREVEKAAILPDTDASKVDKVNKANDDLNQYQFATQQIALPLALVLGILISALGVRGLGNFADLDKLRDYPTQRCLFNVADTLLTGALVGGGSDFMHKVITTFTDLMDATSQKAKTSSP
jgi:H+/Cl- antiporter ClcA